MVCCAGSLYSRQLESGRSRDIKLAGQGTSNLQQVPVISIVDDDESVLEGTKCLIRSLGYNAETFSSAEEFLDSGRVNGTACLITDVQMPGLSGPELQDRLIADGYRTPVILMTAYLEERMRERVLNAGAIGYLSKPFSEDRLIECLDKALNSHNVRNRG